MTDLVTTSQALPLAEQWRFAETVSASSILPRAYRDDPGAVLVAVNLGAAMGLAPAESLYRIHVIEGKPSASAELIAANVRRAGHRLRVQGDDQSARAEIVRADDPDFVYAATWTIEKARAAGLSTKDVWKKYASAMLKARAITECARTACPEALYGVTYTEEEAREATHTEPARRESAADVLATVEPVSDDAEPAITDAQMKALHASFGEFGIGTRDDGLDYASQVVGRAVVSTKDLTKAEASAVIDNLKRDIANLPAAEIEPAETEVAP